MSFLSVIHPKGEFSLLPVEYAYVYKGSLTIHTKRFL